MSRAALLLVVGEAFSDKQKTLVLDKIVEDLQSWNDDGARCDVEKELEEFAAEMKDSFGDVTVSGTALSHNSGNLSISILFSPDRKLLLDSLQNFLLLDSHYRHLVYAGQTIAGSGSWILPDDVFTFRNFVKILKDMDSVGVGGDGKGFALNVSSGSEWDWSKGNFSRLSNLGVRQAASEGLSEKGRNFTGFRSFLDSLVAVVEMKDLLPASSTVGMINFSGPTLYIFPGGNGSSALFGVKGFTGLIDGGYSRKSCSWHFSRHLHQIDMVILSHLGASNFFGMQSFLERKVETGSPDVGSVFFNCPEKFRKLSPNPESLKVNLFDAGAALSEKLTSVGLQPQPCFAPQPYQPITLYNKVGFGSVDMYVLNPVQSSEELKSFLHQWSARAESDSFSAHSGVPLSNTLSVSVLLVWKPFAPSAKIVRVLFPGGTPQSKIFEGLDRMKNIPMFERCECSQAELAAKPTKAAQSRPTTLKPTVAKVNGSVDQREAVKGKPMNGSKDSMAGKAKSDAREPPTLVKASIVLRAAKVEPKKTTVTSPANGTASPKTDLKPTTKPMSPAKDAKPASSRNVESLPPKRLAQKPSEAEASPKNKATKAASQPEAVKQTKPARRTEELKAPETVKQATASKQLNTAREPAARQVNTTRDSRAGRHSEPTKQTKASAAAAAAAEAAKQATPKPIRAPTKESDKKGIKQVDPKKPKESEKKDVEKEVKEEVASIQPVEEAKQTETPVSEPVSVAAAAVEQTSAALPSEIVPSVADVGLTLGGDVETATRAVDYDLPSPEDVAQMSQEDEDSFVEELPTETEPIEGDHKDKDSVIAPTADLDLMGNHELLSDHDIRAIHDEDDGKVNNEKEVEDLVYRCEIPQNLESGFVGSDIDAASREVVEERIDAELEEDLEFERAEEAVENLDDSIEDGNAESAQVSYAQDPDVVADQNIFGVRELKTDENVDERKEKDDLELLISPDQGSAHDQDVLEEKVTVVAEGSDVEKEDLENDHDLEERVERKHFLENEHVEKDLFDVHDQDLEEHDLEKARDLEKECDLEKERDWEKDHYLGKEHYMEKERYLEKKRYLEKEEHVENDFLEDHGHRHEDHDSAKEDHDDDIKKEPNSWLLQDSRSPLEQQPGAFHVKSGMARYCEEFGSDEGELAEDEGQHIGRDEVNTGRVTCPGGIQVPDRKVDEEEEEEDELEAVKEEEEMEEEDEDARFGTTERRTVPEIGSEVDVVLSEEEDVANEGGHLPDVLACKRFVIEEEVELVKAVPIVRLAASPPVPEGGQVVVDRDEELVADEGLGKEDDDFGGEDFDVNDQHFGKGDEDFGRVEQDVGRSGDGFDKRGDFERKDEAGFSSDEDLMKDEEAGKAAEKMVASKEGKDDDSDIDLSETKEGLRVGEGSGGSISDNEAEEMEPGVTPSESTDDVLPCALKKDTAIENLAAICAETKEESSDNVVSHSSREQTLGEARPDLVAACEAVEPWNVDTAIELEEEDGVAAEGPDVAKAEGIDGVDVEEPQNLSIDEGILQGKPHDFHLFNRKEEEEDDQESSRKLDNMAANLAHEVIQSSLAAQNLDAASGCFASGPVSVTTLNGTERPEFEEGAHEATPETLKDVKNLVSAMVDTVASTDRTSSGRFNYGFDDERREDAFDADSFDAASAVVQPQFKSGEDSGESDLDEGQDACHQAQHHGGLQLGHEPEDVSRLDEGFEESTGDEGTANVVELLPQRVEKETTKSPSRAEDSEGFGYGASGEVVSEQEEPPFGSGGGPSSEKTVDDSSRPLLDFGDDTEDVSATHQTECGNGCVEAHQDATDHWRTNNLNPFLDPSSVDAAEKREILKEELIENGNRRYFHGMTASGEFNEDFERKLEGDEHSIPSDDNAEAGVPPSHEQDLGDNRGSDDQRATPEDDETAEIPTTHVEGDSQVVDVTKPQAVMETSDNRRTSSFWTYDDDNVQSTESAAVHGAADNILFSEETTNDDAERDINENLGAVAPTGRDGADGEAEDEDDVERVSTQSNASEEGESRSSALLSEQHDEGAESLDSDDAAELDPVKSWGKPMGLPAPMQDSNRSKVKTTTSRQSNDAANLTLPVGTQDKRPAAAKGGDRSFVAPQKKGSTDIRKSGAAVDSKENGSAKTTVAAKKPVTSTAAAPAAKKQTATASDSLKAKPLKHVVPFYVDLTYIPGNGDPSYVDADFFRRVRARYYVLSCLDPDPRFLACLVEGKQTWENKDLSVNVIPAHDSSALHRWFHENAKLAEELKISLLPAANKCTIKLQDKDDGCYAFRIEF